jgi:RNA polymerase sigma-70 factor (ECF subfamily)
MEPGFPVIEEPKPRSPADDVADLVEKARAGDRAAFREIVGIYQKKVFALSYAFFRNREDALDLVQETFLRVHEKLGTYRAGRNFEAWLLQVARNRCIDHVRRSEARLRARTSPTAVEDLNLPEPDRPGPERLRDIRSALDRCLDRLAGRQRAVFEMRHFAELRNDEIAAALGISTGTVKSLHFKAIRNLRTLMRPYMGWEG